MYCICLIHSSIGGDLGGFHVLAVVKSDAILELSAWIEVCFP